MSYIVGSKDAAVAVAAELTAKRKGMPTAEGGRTVTRYTANKYPGVAGYGVVERWTYNDRPDLPEMGGGFVWNARSLAGK